MATPTSDTAVQRPDLGVLVQEYMESAEELGFVGLQVMPLFETQEQSANYPVIPKEVMLHMAKTGRAMRSKYNRSDWEWEEGYYSTKENGWEEAVDDRELKLYASKFDAEAVASRRASKIILRAQEQRIANLVFNATNFTAHGVTHEWDDTANAVPIDDVATGIEAVIKASGMKPNVLIIARTTWRNLKRNAQIIAQIKYTFPGADINSMSTAQMAHILDIDQVLVAGAVYNSGNKGQDATVADLWSNEYAMLTKIAPGGSDLTEPCLGRTFLWTEDSPTNEVVESYRDEGVRGDVIRVRHDTHESLIKSIDDSGTVKSNISAAVSYLFSNITT
jgi:hypothetical protein